MTEKHNSPTNIWYIEIQKYTILFMWENPVWENCVGDNKKIKFVGRKFRRDEIQSWHTQTHRDNVMLDAPSQRGSPSEVVCANAKLKWYHRVCGVYRVYQQAAKWKQKLKKQFLTQGIIHNSASLLSSRGENSASLEGVEETDILSCQAPCSYHVQRKMREQNTHQTQTHLLARHLS